MPISKYKIGDRFGRLTLIKIDRKDKYWQKYWLCSCICGNDAIVRQGSLANGNTKSCGCISKERTTTHGGSGEKLYQHYRDMLGRCNTRDNCVSEFKDYLHFKEWALNNGYNEGLQLCRNNDIGNYTPSNVRWDTLVANVIEAHAGDFVLLSPQGKEIKVHNLLKFCREHGLIASNLYATYAAGKRKQHKGWVMMEKHGKRCKQDEQTKEPCS